MTASAVPTPLPVAALMRRAGNAQSPRDRHDLAFKALEVAVMLEAAAQLARAAPKDFAMPSLGDWVAVVRRRANASVVS